MNTTFSKYTTPALRFPPRADREQIRDARNLALDADLAVEAAVSDLRLAVERYADLPDLDLAIGALVDAVVARERLTVRLAGLVKAVRRG